MTQSPNHYDQDAPTRQAHTLFPATLADIRLPRVGGTDPTRLSLLATVFRAP
ncbi:hypothetical protein GGQ68_001848 [Sagittula marina]|uniref:Uncharacterized protein n=1 Tax=Sagittula marina TaxID=943940 RepID=A0A7W6DRU8_9RHOB|nr:hypothetical protein [Sagittula marina]